MNMQATRHHRSRRHQGAASKSPGAPATTPSSAPPCRSSARRCARPSICARASASSTSPPATATQRSPRRGASPTSCRRTTSARCSTAGALRAAADRLPVTFQEADAEALPFPDASFDVVLSTFGVMFAPNQQQAASELIRVCRPGGKIGLANWTPDGFIGQAVQDHRQVRSAGAGREVAGAVGQQGASRCPVRPPRRASRRRAGPSPSATGRPEHWLEIFRTYYGPVLKAFAAIDPEAREALKRISTLCSKNSTWPRTARWLSPASTSKW